MKKHIFRTFGIAAFWVLLAGSIMGSVTYAWFTFRPDANIEPMRGTISEGDTTLLISSNQNSEFGKKCLLPQQEVAYEPVSTVDLEHFYQVSLQNREGIALQYQNITDPFSKKILHGVVYLQSLKDHCGVYFDPQGLDFGKDIQALAAFRLGLRFTTQTGTESYLFALNSMGDTKEAVRVVTIPEPGKVVSGLNTEKRAIYVQDPAKELAEYFASYNASDSLWVAAGKPLCQIQANEVATVEYWFYLEGCDEHCSNTVQNKEIPFQLSFVGVTKE